MHFFVSWDIKSLVDTNNLNNQLKNCLKGYSWVRPMKNIYIVKVDSVEDRATIRQSLISIARRNPKKVNIIISPVMDGGSYSGWLPLQLWDKIKKRTNME